MSAQPQAISKGSWKPKWVRPGTVNYRLFKQLTSAEVLWLKKWEQKDNQVVLAEEKPNFSVLQLLATHPNPLVRASIIQLSTISKSQRTRLIKQMWKSPELIVQQAIIAHYQQVPYEAWEKYATTNPGSWVSIMNTCPYPTVISKVLDLVLEQNSVGYGPDYLANLRSLLPAMTLPILWRKEPDLAPLQIKVYELYKSFLSSPETEYYIDLLAYNTTNLDVLRQIICDYPNKRQAILSGNLFWKNHLATQTNQVNQDYGTGDSIPEDWVSALLI